MASVVDQFKAENRQLHNENEVQKANIEVLLHNAEVAKAKIDRLTASLVRTKNELDDIAFKLSQTKAALKSMTDEYRVLDDQLCQCKNVDCQVDDISSDPDFKVKISEATKQYQVANDTDSVSTLVFN